MTLQIIDADGHINDHACGAEIARYMPKGNQMANLFPELDHLHFRYLKQKRRATGNPSPEDWNEFLDKTDIAWSVLYPTAGLAVGRIVASVSVRARRARGLDTVAEQKLLTVRKPFRRGDEPQNKLAHRVQCRPALSVCMSLSSHNRSKKIRDLV